MADQINYYGVLEVVPTASAEAIKGAYKYLAQRWHPDKNMSAEAPRMSALLNEAYAVLSDPKARADYDRALGAVNAQPQPTPSPPPSPQSRPTTVPRLRPFLTTVLDWIFGLVFVGFLTNVALLILVGFLLILFDLRVPPTVEPWVNLWAVYVIACVAAGWAWQKFRARAYTPA